jgi:hypothetical protein
MNIEEYEKEESFLLFMVITKKMKYYKKIKEIKSRFGGIKPTTKSKTKSPQQFGTTQTTQSRVFSPTQ